VSALGRPRLHLRETDSTNSRARGLALAGAPHGTLVTAGAQTAGRGRHGRSWLAPAGSSVLASFVLREVGQRHQLLPLAAAIAACEACERAAPVTCRIKWPNDVWIDGRKVAGILLEGRPQEGWAVLGVGINVGSWPDPPAELAATATSLEAASQGLVEAPLAHGDEQSPPARAEGGSPLEVERVLAALVSALESWLAADPSAVVAAWAERDALRGRHVRWDEGGGVAEGIDRSGALLVSTRNGRVELHAGEVSLVRPVEEAGV
jgi:BirA family transcriptional regulator, biotin operon repressor / biotin---[acetyl-CoA-carboxylase] ligase